MVGASGEEHRLCEDEKIGDDREDSDFEHTWLTRTIDTTVY